MKFPNKDEWRNVMNGTVKCKIMPHPYTVGDVVACVDEKGKVRGQLRIVGCTKSHFENEAYLITWRVSEVKA